MSNPYIQALLHLGIPFAWPSGPIEYVFDDSSSLAPWTEGEKHAVRTAMNAWELIANVDFSPASSPDNAELFLIKQSLNKNELGRTTLLFFDDDSVGAEIRFDTSQHDDWSTNIKLGGFAYGTIIHELGHALGLAHPHPEDVNDTSFFPGVVSIGTNSWSTGNFGQNAVLYTAMSNNYEDWAPPGGQFQYGFIGGPMAFDIAAVQAIYGRPIAPTNTSNNNYLLRTADKVGTYYRTIWDQGGNDSIWVDPTIMTSVTIDLRPADLTYGAQPDGYTSSHPGGYLSRVDGVHGGFTIANGVAIERAYGGAGRDTLTGNNLNNIMDGRAGSDRLVGRSGSDQLRGGDNGDSISGDYYFREWTHPNRAIWDPSSQTTVLLANSRYATITQSDGRFTPPTDDGPRPISGPVHDRLYGEGGGDFLFGGFGKDTLDGGTENDELSGGAGNDILIGGPGSDILNGGLGFDTLDGGQGSDRYLWLYDADPIQESGAPTDLDQLIFALPTVTAPVGVEELRYVGTEPLTLTVETPDVTRIEVGGFGSTVSITAAQSLGVQCGPGQDTFRFHNVDLDTVVFWNFGPDDLIDLTGAGWDRADMSGGDGDNDGKIAGVNDDHTWIFYLDTDPEPNAFNYVEQFRFIFFNGTLPTEMNFV